jgi:hypothetical protein
VDARFSKVTMRSSPTHLGGVGLGEAAELGGAGPERGIHHTQGPQQPRADETLVALPGERLDDPPGEVDAGVRVQEARA